MYFNQMRSHNLNQMYLIHKRSGEKYSFQTLILLTIPFV